MQSAVAKARGHTAQTKYPQPEGNLADVMTKGQLELGDESLFGTYASVNDIVEIVILCYFGCIQLSICMSITFDQKEKVSNHICMFDLEMDGYV